MTPEQLDSLEARIESYGRARAAYVLAIGKWGYGTDQMTVLTTNMKRRSDDIIELVASFLKVPDEHTPT